MKQFLQLFRLLILTGLSILMHAPALSAEISPEVLFSAFYDALAGDWRITIQSDGRGSVLYYAEGRFLKEEHLSTQENYRRLIYPFPEKAADPATMPPEQIERFAQFGSTENRRRSTGSGKKTAAMINGCSHLLVSAGCRRKV